MPTGPSAGETIVPVSWPSVLVPRQILANLVPFSRSGGVSQGGIERSIKTDRGRWLVEYKQVALATEAMRRAWNKTRVYLGGTAGLAIIPVWSDEANEDDLEVKLAVAAALGATSVQLRLVDGTTLEGIRFSYQNALYETGPATSIVGDVWTVPVFPAIRAAIPDESDLETDLPTCLVRLASDRQMDAGRSAGGFDLADVAFVEAADYWADLALDEGS